MYHHHITLENNTIFRRRQTSKFNAGKFLLIFIPVILFAGFLLLHRGKSQKNNVLPEAPPSAEELISQHYYNTLTHKPSDETPFVLTTEESTADEPIISGKSAIVVEKDNGKILFDKNSNEKLKLASLAKIMTAVVVLEHKDLNEKTTVSEKASSIGENIMGISAGETYTLNELMYGLLLNSGNDAAYALAEDVTGDSDTFVSWMNLKAVDLGLNDTHFSDPSGLDDASYTTTRDLVVLTEYAMRFPEFREIVGTFSKELPYSDEHKYLYLENQTNLLTTYPGDIGVKTGYTEEAGLCLVSYAVNGGKEMIGVVLDSQNRKGDMVLLLDHGFAAAGVKIAHPRLTF